jgi:arginyl-tRNA synthetase
MSLKAQLAEQLTHILEKLDIHDIQPLIDYPSNPEFGDFSTNVAMMAAKKAGKNPRELAEELRREMGEGRWEKVEIAGPGFINFWIKDSALLAEIESVKNSNTVVERKEKGKVIVEYSSPNIAKPFTVGHLRSTIIGDAVANLLEVTGWTVYRDNHVGDWGTQFGKQICAIKKWGNIEEIEKADRPVKNLVELYIKFHEEAEKHPELEDEAREWFKKLEDGDKEAREIWQQCIDWSWKEFQEIYDELGVPSGKDAVFENNGRGYGESYFEDKMDGVIQELKVKHVLHEGKEGAQIVEYPESSKLPPLMILKKDGATLYATRDLATDKFRLEKYGKDVVIINEVGAEQSLYMQQIYMLEQMLGWVEKQQRVHIRHGLYRFKEGKMSTRKGNVIWLEEVLEEAKKRAWNLQKHETVLSETDAVTINKKEGKAAQQHVLGADHRLKIATMVGIGAIKWNDLKRSPDQDVVFDWDEILTMQGNSGPYIQYTFARTQSVLKKGDGRREMGDGINSKLNKEERDLLRLLSRFSDIVHEAAMRYSPNILATYLFELAQAYNLFYQKHQILNAELEILQVRLLLTSVTGKILHQGLSLLGISAPENM